MGSFARRFVRHRFEGRRAAISLAALAVLVGAAIALFTSSEADGPARARGDAAKQAAATVDAFDHAVVAQRFTTVCDHLFTPEARAAAGGTSCAAALAASGQAFTRLRVTALSLRGDYATATVIADQAGRQPVAETLELVRRGQRFLISSSLGPPEN